MAVSVTSRIVLDVQSTKTNPLDLESPISQLSYRKVWDFANGSGANQANKSFSDQRTLAISTAEDIDLAGVLVDSMGTTLTFSRIVAVIIAASSANTNTVDVKPGAATGFVSWCNAAADKVKIRPGGVMVLIAPDATGYATAAGATDLLNIGNGGAGTTVSYDLLIVGS
jgi:hypothetical protein